MGEAECDHLIARARSASRLLSGVGHSAMFSASTTPGLMLAMGNVGAELGNYEDASTFLTRDGGVTWSEVRRGPHLYEFGDRGALLVLVNDKDATNHILYVAVPDGHVCVPPPSEPARLPAMRWGLGRLTDTRGTKARLGIPTSSRKTSCGSSG